MKKLTAFIVFVTFLLTSSFACAKQEAAPKEAVQEADVEKATVDVARNNPIEKAFAKDFETAVATPEINYVAEKYSEAWQAELKVVSEKVKKLYTQKDDVKRVDDYLASYENLVKQAFDLEMLNWLDDVSKPASERAFGTGGPGAAMLAQGNLYKQATLNLIVHFNTANPDAEYTFSYKGKGADLEALRNQGEK